MFKISRKIEYHCPKIFVSGLIVFNLGIFDRLIPTVKDIHQDIISSSFDIIDYAPTTRFFILPILMPVAITYLLGEETGNLIFKN